jgi:hypothetical protein
MCGLPRSITNGRSRSPMLHRFRHEPLTTDLVRRLNPKAEMVSLADDIEEIGYPEAPR